MFRYYKVPVYELQEDLVSYNQLDYIVVTPYHLFAKELLTGYFSIEILTKEMVNGNRLKLIRGNTLETKKQNRGVALFTFKEEFIPKNLVTKQFLDYYVDNFDNSKFNNIYKNIDNKKLRNIGCKIRSLKNSKRG
ncbi:MAG TPA: hypothetical protein IAB59_03560 [Candidatus Onthousia faecipullorum]|uniref:Uncharacterized protein n=1 Tax=Candidatus Onthousia faecipullorum TaxID=2840887 RepID=A0A9D1KBF5_9FIRM|nr:hypothetical protein [Candidatus Onthousia faecipullorum]